MPYKTAEGKIILVLQMITSAILSYWASMPSLSGTLAWMVLVDYATGLVASIGSKELSSAVGWAGIKKKVFYFVAVAVAHELSDVLGFDGDIGSTVALFLVINEGISIFENLAKIGVPLPNSLTETLAKLREK